MKNKTRKNMMIGVVLVVSMVVAIFTLTACEREDISLANQNNTRTETPRSTDLVLAATAEIEQRLEAQDSTVDTALDDNGTVYIGFDDEGNVVIVGTDLDVRIDEDGNAYIIDLDGNAVTLGKNTVISTDEDGNTVIRGAEVALNTDTQGNTFIVGVDNTRVSVGNNATSTNTFVQAVTRSNGTVNLSQFSGTTQNVLSDEAWETEFLRLLNAERAKRGLDPVGMDNDFAKEMARIRAAEATPELGHTRPNGDGKGGLTENLAFASFNATPQEIFDAWMDSPGHRNAMLNANVSNIGIAVNGGTTALLMEIIRPGIDTSGMTSEEMRAAIAQNELEQERGRQAFAELNARRAERDAQALVNMSEQEQINAIVDFKTGVTNRLVMTGISAEEEDRLRSLADAQIVANQNTAPPAQSNNNSAPQQTQPEAPTTNNTNNNSSVAQPPANNNTNNGNGNAAPPADNSNVQTPPLSTPPATDKANSGNSNQSEPERTEEPSQGSHWATDEEYVDFINSPENCMEWRLANLTGGNP